MFWNAVTAIASVVSMVAFILTALFLRDQLEGERKDRYLSVTNDLFGLWQTPEFMQAQLWLIHRLEEVTWIDFVSAHRGEYGETAFHRVGSFYDRVGTLVRLGFVDDREILSTMGGYAIAVWGKVGPLVKEARRIENSTLFDDFERLLPACHECYVPTLAPGRALVPFATPVAAPAPAAADRPEPKVSARAVRRRLDAGERLTVLDVRHGSQVDAEHPVLPGSIHVPADEVDGRLGEIPAAFEAVVLCA